MTTRRRSLEQVAERVRARENPRRHRVRIHIPVTIDRDGILSSGVITNLSKDGFRMETDEPLTPDQSISLLRDSQAVEATIKWVEGPLVGGLFTKDRPQW